MIPKLGSEINQMMMVREANTSMLADGNILFDSQNFQSVEQFQRLTSTYFASKQRLLCLDHEGGRVHRVGEIIVPPLPSANAIRRTNCVEVARKAGELAGKQLSFLGINMSLGPVLDLGGASSAFPSRCFGENADEAIQFQNAYIEGLKDYVLICPKHFPGHGAVEGDSHHVLPTTNLGFEELKETHLKPFEFVLSKTHALMTAHIVVNNWDSENPATFSTEILSYVRELKPEIVIISDSLTMAGASSKFNGNRLMQVISGIRAGCDLFITGKLTSDEISILRKGLIEEASKDDSLRKLIGDSSFRISNLLASLTTLDKFTGSAIDLEREVRELGEKIATQSILKINVEPKCFQTDEKILLVGPKLLENGLKQACVRAFGDFPIDIHVWTSLSPTEEEILNINTIFQNFNTVFVITYDSYKKENKNQRKLVKILSQSNKVRLCVCESNYTPSIKHMQFVPENKESLCTFSADSTSLGIGLKMFYKN